MGKITKSYIEQLKNNNIVESHLHNDFGHIVITNIIYCSREGGKKGRGKKFNIEV